MMSQGSQAVSQAYSIAGGGSVLGGGGFQFDDDEVGVDVVKSVRRMQKDMLKEIDNYAVLKSYGIEINDAKNPAQRQNGDEELKINDSGKFIE